MENEKQCSICYNNIDMEKSVYTSCKHRFCSTCFFNWMKQKTNCPVCRKNFGNQSHQEKQNEMIREANDWEEYINDLREDSTILETKINEKYGDLIDLERKEREIIIRLNKKHQMIIQEEQRQKETQLRRATYIKEWSDLHTHRIRRRRFGLQF